MKRLTVLLTVFIILSHISICSFAFEATNIEQSAYRFASEFLNKYISNVDNMADYNLSDQNLAYFDKSPQKINEIFLL